MESSYFSDMSDEALVLLARNADSEAMAVLIARMTPAVRRLAARYKVFGDSDDLAQEGMIGLLSAIRTFEPERGASFRTYATTCASNCIISAVRKGSRRRETASGEIFGSSENTLSVGTVSGGDPEAIVIGRDEADRLTRILAQNLSDFETDVLRLYITGLKYSDIADRLSSTEKSVDNALQRIRKKLKVFY